MADDSDFDLAYLAAWLAIKGTPGLFRNTAYEATQRRALAPGVHGAVCQFSAEHLKNKRPTSMVAEDARVVRPFDASLFHFGKVTNPAEVCVRVSLDAADADAAPALVWAAGGVGATGAAGVAAAPTHPVFANISPIMGAHGLLVPSLEACHPQVMTPAHLCVALRIMALSRRRDFHLGFNSLCAWASVNHCHWHVTYISDCFEDGLFAVEHASTAALAAVTLPPAPAAAAPASARVVLEAASLTGWPLGGFRFRLVPDGSGSSHRAVPDGSGGGSLRAGDAPHPRHAAALAAAAGAVVTAMTARGVAHNLLLAQRGGCVYVLPRAHQRAGVGADDGRMAVAFAESCGIAIVYSQAAFDAFTEAEYVAALEAHRVAAPTLDALCAAAVGGVQAQAAGRDGGGDGGGGESPA